MIKSTTTTTTTTIIIIIPKKEKYTNRNRPQMQTVSTT